MKNQITSIDIADLLRRFLDGNVEPMEWDDFLSWKNLGDQKLVLLQKILNSVWSDFPSAKTGYYCSDKGLEFLARTADLIDKAAWEIEEIESLREYLLRTG